MLEEVEGRDVVIAMCRHVMTVRRVLRAYLFALMCSLLVTFSFTSTTSNFVCLLKVVCDLSDDPPFVHFRIRFIIVRC